jgi:hypothetical protein
MWMIRFGYHRGTDGSLGRDFDNWGTSTVCFVLDKTRMPGAGGTVRKPREEFVKRAAFALIASLACMTKPRGERSRVPAIERVQRTGTHKKA